MGVTSLPIQSSKGEGGQFHLRVCSKRVEVLRVQSIVRRSASATSRMVVPVRGGLTTAASDRPTDVVVHCDSA